MTTPERTPATVTEYAHVTADGVTAGPLPTAGVLSDGRSVSGYDLLPPATLKAEGWLPVVDSPPPTAAADEELTSTLEVRGDTVVRVHTVTKRRPPEPAPLDPVTARARELRGKGTKRTPLEAAELLDALATIVLGEEPASAAPTT